MKIYKFDGLLQKNGWISPAFVTVSSKGKIKSINNNYKGRSPITVIQGYALPGFFNAHSHAFQYAMAGLAERQTKADDFWSWREAMYQLALTVSPEQMEAIATMLYSEMIRHGYTHVAEFHYLHHNLDGSPYKNKAEMGTRLIKAAKKAKINITLIPVFYQKGGFGKEHEENQKRFISSTSNEYIKLLEASEKACELYKGASLGIGIHSLRAVDSESIKDVVAYNSNRFPFHIHIAEQVKEVEDCLNFYEKRPVEWLADNIELNENFHLVHATHLNQQEINSIAQSGANVVLCPSTEGNLGDGLFPLIAFQKAGGKWSIGTDSHVGLNPLEELRWLDYGQRLTHRTRTVFTDYNETSGALYALNQCFFSGAKAMGTIQTDFFETGKRFNASVYSSNHPLIKHTSEENLLNTILYSSDSSMHLATLVNGKLIVYKGKHKKGEKIKTAFETTLKELNNR